MISGAHKLAAPVVKELLEAARDAELSRNIALMREALAPVWADIDNQPDFAGFDTLTEARLLRRAGFLLSFAGRCYGMPQYHLRAKDLLSSAANLFSSVNSSDEEAEANVMLALAYWHSGEVDDSKAILSVVDRDYRTGNNRDLHLQIQLNRLLAYFFFGEHKLSLDVIRSIRREAQATDDKRLLTMFHNQAGLTLGRLGEISRARFELDMADSYAFELGNERFHGFVLNNRAVVEDIAGQWDDALAHLDRASEIFRSLGDVGWLPHLLDTKASILLNLGRQMEALSVIDQAISQFRDTGEYSGLCDAKWTRCRVLFSMDRTEEALQTYARLYAIANGNIGQESAAKYTRQLVETLGKAETCDDIDRLRELSTDDPRESIHYFFVPAKGMSDFGVDQDCAVPVRHPIERLRDGIPVIYVADGKLHLKRIQYDSWANIYCIAHDPNFPEPLQEDRGLPVIGEVLGYRPIADMEPGTMEFYDFPPA